MKKVYKKLTKEQIKRNVIFSSCLSESRTELINDCVHEVIRGEEDINATINRLLDDKFFNSSHFKFNIVRR